MGGGGPSAWSSADLVVGLGLGAGADGRGFLWALAVNPDGAMQYGSDRTTARLTNRKSFIETERNSFGAVSRCGADSDYLF
jgi:hypothetical protein